MKNVILGWLITLRN